MKRYQLINNITAWVVFAISAFTYLSTIEPTASFWDCGEFITSAFKLEVGHPPGAPFFMLLGRFFSLFAFGDVTQVAVMINAMSALVSAFTILFLFWSITHIARRIIAKDKNTELTQGQTIAIMAAGAIGALAYNFSDTFWFSAVEGEVYAMSSFFTAAVFWAILKWEEAADEKYANRWIILIAYLMGLSIGVHLLNLLAIPAIVFVYYFKKYPVTTKGVVITSAIAIAILAIIMYGIIQGAILFGWWFELFFTNTIGLPFYSGSFIYLILLFGGICFGTWYTYQKRKALLNTVFLILGVILIGYSSFALIVIRSSADTPMDQNNPDNMFSLLSYLNREQYGDRPLFTGEYFNAPVEGIEDGKATYIQKDGKYVISDRKFKRIYRKGYTTIFPRMYSDQENHNIGYQQWTGLSDADLYEPRLDQKGEYVKDEMGNIVYDTNKAKKAPSFGDNLKFFFKYQINFMYFRYFMWNFAGRQNDIQGFGNITDGNWISGIPFIDSMRLGPQDNIPSTMKNNKARNVYFFIPLILGILGMIYMFRANITAKKYFTVVLMFFFFTGLAIVLYLNQTPFQPRERDYAYAGSFYAFAIFLGFGVLFIYDIIKKYSTELIGSGLAALLGISAPVLMAAQNWDDHDRSNRYTARDFASNYLNSCPPNAILFTNGDNDTFPLWYAQEVEGIRTDVRVINLSYLNTDWYIDQMKRQSYNSAPVPFSLSREKYLEGTRDVIYAYENPGLFIYEKYLANKYKYEQQYKAIYDQFYEIVKKSNFPQMQKKDFETLSAGYNTISPLQLNSLINTLAKKENVEKFGIDNTAIQSNKSLITGLVGTIAKDYLPIDVFMDFITSDDPQAKAQMGSEEANYLPTNKLALAVKYNDILANKVVAENAQKSIVNSVNWQLQGDYLRKSDLMVLDLINSNNWKRPICFAITVGGEGYVGIENYFQLDGLAYRLVPIYSSNKMGEKGRIDVDTLYNNVMNKFKWGNINNPNVYLDENNLRMLMNVKNNFARLAGELLKAGKRDSAVKVLDKAVELMPHEQVPYNYYNLLLADQYYAALEDEKGNQIIRKVAEITEEELNYYLSLDEKWSNSVAEDLERSMAVCQEIIRIVRKNNRPEIDKEISDKFAKMLETNIPVVNQINTMKDNTMQLYQWYGGLSPKNQQAVSFYIFLKNMDIK